MSAPASKEAAEPSRELPLNGIPGEDISAMLLPSLYRLTEGLPRKELKAMIVEAKACEDALHKEIQDLKAGIKQDDGDDSPANIMLQTEVTPPDRFFTVSALLGRLRDDVATPLPPNSTLPHLRAQAGLVQPPQKKKKTNSGSVAATKVVNDTTKTVAPLGRSTLDKQKLVLSLHRNPAYRQEHDQPGALLALWKKISTHRSAAVFRRPVNSKEAPGYTDRICFPIDLSLIRKMIVARIIKSYSDLHQRVGMICHNCMKYNGRESDYGVVTREFEGFVDEFLVAAVATGAASAPPLSKSPNNPAVSAIAPASAATPAATDATVVAPAAEGASSVGKSDIQQTTDSSAGTQSKAPESAP